MMMMMMIIIIIIIRNFLKLSNNSIVQSSRQAYSHLFPAIFNSVYVDNICICEVSSLFLMECKLNYEHWKIFFLTGT
jgi:hypothetical protein